TLSDDERLDLPEPQGVEGLPHTIGGPSTSGCLLEQLVQESLFDAPLDLSFDLERPLEDLRRRCEDLTRDRGDQPMRKCTRQQPLQLARGLLGSSQNRPYELTSPEDTRNGVRQYLLVLI